MHLLYIWDTLYTVNYNLIAACLDHICIQAITGECGVVVVWIGFDIECKGGENTGRGRGRGVGGMEGETEE